MCYLIMPQPARRQLLHLHLPAHPHRLPLRDRPLRHQALPQRRLLTHLHRLHVHLHHRVHGRQLRDRHQPVRCHHLPEQRPVHPEHPQPDHIMPLHARLHRYNKTGVSACAHY